MIDSFSPLTRKLIALGLPLLLLLAAAQLIAGVLLPAAIDAVDELGAVRARAARLSAVAKAPRPQPVPEMPAGLIVAAANADEANAAVQAGLRDAGAAAGVVIEQLAPTPATSPRLTAISLGATGPETQLLAFLSAVEGRQPLTRFRQWRLSRSDGAPGQLRIDGIVEAAWAAAP